MVSPKTSPGFRFSMGLRPYIFLLQASVMVVLIIFLFAYWTPSLLERERSQYITSIKSHINTVAETMVPVILEDQVASIYEILDALLEANSTWRSIEFFDAQGWSVYPLKELEESGAHISESNQIFEQPVMLNGTKLGQLRFHIDFTQHIANAKSAYQELIIAFMALLFVLGAFGAVVVELIIRRPIGALVAAAKRMGENDFYAELPSSRLTELNNLTNRFSIMRERMSLHQEELETKVEEQTQDIRRNAGFTNMILNSMPSAVVVHDAEGVTMANQAAEIMFGLSGYETNKTFLRDALSRVGLSADDVNLVRSGSAFGQEKFSYQGSSGRQVHLAVSQTPLQQDGGEIDTRHLIVAEDVSAQFDAQSEREKLEYDLLQAQKLEAVGQLAGGIAHEINTPSQYIGDNLQFLSEAQEAVLAILARLLDLNRKCAHIDAVSTEVSEIDTMIEDRDLLYLLEEIPSATEQSLNGITEVSRIVLAMKDFSHPGTKEMSACDINKAISTTLIVSRGEWKSIAEVEENFSESLPLIKCFLGEINQVLLNLVINAAHAIDEKQSPDPGKILVSTTLEDGHIVIRIADNGNGIPKEVSDKVFNPFFTTKEVGKGTGQGLSIAWDIVVTKHKGNLEFESEEGVGTTFIISLPIDNEDRGNENQSSILVA